MSDAGVIDAIRALIKRAEALTVAERSAAIRYHRVELKQAFE